MFRITSTIQFGRGILQKKFPLNSQSSLKQRVSSCFYSKRGDFSYVSLRFLCQSNTSYELNLTSWNINTVDIPTLATFVNECRVRDIHVIALQEVNKSIIDSVDILAQYEKIALDSGKVSYSIAYREGEYASKQDLEKSYMLLWDQTYITLNYSERYADKYPKLDFALPDYFNEGHLERRPPVLSELTHNVSQSSFSLLNWHNEAGSAARDQYHKLEVVLSENVQEYGGAYVAAGDFNVTRDVVTSPDSLIPNWEGISHPPVPGITAGVDHMLTNGKVVDYYSSHFEGFLSDNHFPISGKCTLKMEFRWLC